MPFTPFHFGPGVAIKAVMPRHFSFTVFCFAQVVTDLETAYHMLRGEYPLHRWLHTFVGATAVAIFCVIVGRPICQLALRFWVEWREAPFKPYFPVTERIPLASAITGAFIGTYSHIFLDGIMHGDVMPFSPWGTQNPFYRIIGFFTLHALCVFLALGGVWYVATRSTKRP